MTNDNFIKYYVEILNSTLHEAIGKNLVFQAQSKLDKEELELLQEQISKYNLEKNTTVQNQSSMQNLIQSLNNKVEELSRENNKLQKAIAESKENVFSLEKKVSGLEKENSRLLKESKTQKEKQETKKTSKLIDETKLTELKIETTDEKESNVKENINLIAEEF